MFAAHPKNALMTDDSSAMIASLAANGSVRVLPDGHCIIGRLIDCID